MRKKSSAVLRWEGDLVLARVHELKASLETALASADRVELDVSAATGADASGLQLLCALHREAGCLGKSVGLSAVPASPLRDCAEKGGFLRTRGCAADCLWAALSTSAASGVSAGA